MGMMVEGRWTTNDRYMAPDGRFKRNAASFRRHITADGASGLPAASGRYHLYVSYACPWAHRTLIVRALLGLEDAIGVSVVHPLMLEDGWVFGEGPGCTPDAILGSTYLRDVYAAAMPDYTGRVTVPILWDTVTGTIVNNESREIIRMFDRAFDGVARHARRLWTPELEGRIDAGIDAIYEPINNGVYRAGFAGSQAAYEEAVSEVFAALDHWEAVLGDRDWIAGDVLTEADICLFTTLFRFDPVYVTHFRCNLRRLQDYPNLNDHMRAIYQLPGVRETCNLDHIKGHYFRSHRSINPKGIVPAGPILDLDRPASRTARFAHDEHHLS
jgi:putative glutathione S-transferase